MDMARAMQALAEGEALDTEEVRDRIGSDDSPLDFGPSEDAQCLVDLG